MADNLLTDAEESRRSRLRARGWRETGGTLRGRLMWRRPGDDGAVSEDEAFAALDRLEREEDGRD